MTNRKIALALACALSAPIAAETPLAVETFDAAWKIVRDSHFDPHMNGVDWNAVRTELRPRAAAAATPAELRAVIREMLGRLGQSHFALIPSASDTSGADVVDTHGDPGFDVRLVGRDMLVTHVDATGGAADAAVRPGWRLLAVGSKPVSALIDAFPSGTPDRLLQVEAWRAIENRLRGPEHSAVTVTFDDGTGRSVAKAIERRPEPGEPVTVGHLPTMHVRVDAERQRTPSGASVGVIRFNVWMAAVDAQFQDAVDNFRQADGIVIDLRGNPGGLAAMLMGISGHFLEERKPLGVMKTRDSEFRFVANPRLVSATGTKVRPFAGPVAILVDALTGSASECFTGGMQAIGRARVFGQPSMGQALPALFDKLPNGDVLIHAYADFVTADGTRLEGRGVIPDEQVPLHREDLVAGRDAPLLTALEWIDRARRGTAVQ